jgi:hypothetical protein
MRQFLAAGRRFFVLTTSNYYALAIPDFGLVTALSSMLVVVALVSMALQFGIQKGESRYTVISGKSVHPSELKLSLAPGTGSVDSRAICKYHFVHD